MPDFSGIAGFSRTADRSGERALSRGRGWRQWLKPVRDAAQLGTDYNLRHLGQLAEPMRNPTPDDVTDRFRGVITVDRVLPRAVKAHLNLPFLFIADNAYRWSQERLEQKVSELTSALFKGLEAIESDPTLKREGGADLSDRPATKGEEIAAALSAYRDCSGPAELSQLRQAVYGTSLYRQMDRLDKWLARKRPSPGGPSIEYEIACVLGDIDRRADDWHHEPASPHFARW